MEISLDKAAIAKLPAPGEDGIIRCTAGLKMGSEGKPMLVELNDMPVGGDESPAEPKPEDMDAAYSDATGRLENL